MTKRKRPTRTIVSVSPLTTAQHAVIAAAAPKKRGRLISSIVADVDSSLWNTFAAISDPQNAPIFSPEAAKQLVEHVRVNGDSHVLAELLPTARELHNTGQMSDAALSSLVLFENTKPMDEAEVITRVEKMYPKGDQSVSLEDILSPELLAPLES